MMNIPNMITIFRIILVPLFLYVFHSNMDNSIFYAGMIFIVAGLSDILDGQIARRFNMATKLGSVLDPFADKIMSFAILYSFAVAELIPPWILIPLVVKEIVMILGAGLLYIFHEKEAVPADKFGKLATMSFYAAILSIFFKAPSVLSNILLVVTLVINLIAFINYINIFIRVKKNKSVNVDK